MKKSVRLLKFAAQSRRVVRPDSAAVLLSLSLLLSASASANGNELILTAHPGSPPVKASASLVATQKELKHIETRYFFHSYDHDPIEKRLERLELLVFGSAQFGVNEERFAQLKVAIQKHDRESAAMMKQQHSAAAKRETASKADQEASYPVLTTLEWKVLKKTYKNESMDQRLDRLETTLLGKASPAMSYFDRIERLGKIAGVPTSSPVAEKTLPSGPMPRAGGSGGRDLRSRAFSFGPRTFMAPMPDGDSTFEDDMHRRAQKDLSQIFKFMDQRFGDIFQGMPRPFPALPNSPGGGGDDETSPYATPSEEQEIPPYADPNSI